jgi:hypothetical protein
MIALRMTSHRLQVTSYGRALKDSQTDPAAARARQLKGQSCTVRTFVPEGLSESSPVRSAGK